MSPSERDTGDLSHPGTWGVAEDRSLLARAVDVRRGRARVVIAVAAAVIVVVAARGGEPGTLYTLAAVLGAIGGLVVLPDGVVSLPTIGVRVRAAALVVAGGLGWAVVAVAIASGLRLAIGDDGGVGVGVALVTLGSYVLGMTAAVGLTSSPVVHGERR